MGIDLNALAAQLATELAAEQYPVRTTDQAESGTPRGMPTLAEPAAAGPRGVTFAAADGRLGDHIDHTLLHPEATLPEIERLCAEAREHRFAAVCVNPIWVPGCARLLRGSAVQLAAVIGFPFGAAHTEIKAAEAALAVRQGAHELDVVVSLGALRGGRWDDVEADVADVVRAAGGALVKVVLETALLAPMELVKACLVVRDAGAHYLKTSTGFHLAGGASADTVALMRLAVGDTMGVKASGGIRDAVAALAMLAAGATRIGTSAGVAMADVRGPGPQPMRRLIAFTAVGHGEGEPGAAHAASDSARPSAGVLAAY